MVGQGKDLYQLDKKLRIETQKERHQKMHKHMPASTDIKDRT
jgi:hypothetical protein